VSQRAAQDGGPAARPAGARGGGGGTAGDTEGGGVGRRVVKTAMDLEITKLETDIGKPCIIVDGYIHSNKMLSLNVNRYLGDVQLIERIVTQDISE